VYVAVGLTAVSGALAFSEWHGRPNPPGIDGKAPRGDKYARVAFELLGGLELYESLGGWMVKDVRLYEGEVIDVLVERDGMSFSIIVKPRGTSEGPPPVQTDHYDLVISTPEPAVPLPPGEGMAVLREVHARVEANEPP
jgi:hypothetical protein